MNTTSRVFGILCGIVTIAATLTGCGGGGGGGGGGGVTPPGQVAMPLFQRAPGYFTGSINLEMTCATAGATINYTLDGTEPSASSMAYTTAVPLSTTTLVKARAYYTDWTPSTVNSGQFSVTSAYVFSAETGVKGTAAGQFRSPFNVASTGTDVWIADTLNNRVQRLDLATLSHQASYGTTGSLDGQFMRPFDLGVHPVSGNLYVADTFNYRIQVLNATTGAYLSQFGTMGTGPGQFALPVALAFDAAGNVYVADASNHRIQKFLADGTYLTSFGSFGTGNGQLNSPYGLAVSGTALYVADTFNNRIQKLTTDGIFVLAFGSFGSGDGQFDRPFGLAVDTAGNLLVADSNNNRVQKFDTLGAFMTQFGFAGPLPGQFSYLTGVDVTPAGDILATDNLGCRIERFVVPPPPAP